MEGLSAICVGLGVAEEDENGDPAGYSKGEYCLDNLKDLLRFLRRDDPENRDVFKQVCKWNIVSKDLIPIIESFHDDQNLVLNAVKVLVFLTMPIEPTSADIAQQMENLWVLKSAVTCSDIVAVIVSLLESPLENLDCGAFTEDDWKLVQLVLTFFRNILAIQEISSQQKAGGSANEFLSLRDKFLEVLFRENVMELIVVITQHVGGSTGYFRHDNLLLLEIFHYIFISQDPELIAKAHLKGDEAEDGTKASVNSLMSMMNEEQKRKLSRLRDIGRHSQLGGTFTRHAMDGSKVVLKGKPTLESCNTLLNSKKVCRGLIKKIAWDRGHLVSTKDKILQLLHDFLNQFLSGGYNTLMKLVCEDIEKEHHAVQKNDIIVFFQVAQFAISFQQHKFSTSPEKESDLNKPSIEDQSDCTNFKGDICGPIAATMNESMFQLVILNWRSAFDGLKETNDFKFLSAAGCLMKNMIRMLDLVLKLLPEDSKEPQIARILLYKLFYDQTDQGVTHFLLNLIKSFDNHKQPKSDLADLVEMIYKVTQLMDKLQERGTLRVTKKSRKGRKAKSSNEKRKTQLDDNNIIDNTNDNTNPGWSSDNNVNNDGSKTECGDKETENVIAQAEADVYCTTDTSGDEKEPAYVEVDFKVSTLVSMFGSNSIVQKLCWLLKFYKSNSTGTNHYIICILRRIIDDLELSPMLYQLSLLNIFYEILVDQESSPSNEYASIVDFLMSFVGKMLRRIKSQPLLFVEILFWKTRKECHDINAEHLLHNVGRWKKESRNWGNVSGDRDNGSYVANKAWTRRSIADALGEDEADVVISSDFGDPKGEDKFCNVDGGMATASDGDINGKEYSIDDVKSMCFESKEFSRKKKRLVLDGMLESKIRDLHEKFKDNPNCSRLIAEALDADGKVSAAQISNKLKKLGLGVARRKRMQHGYDAFSIDTNKHKEEERIPLECNDIEGSLQNQPLNKRKRIHAFNKDQEAKIKSLYEQFKDQKRCSYMIAEALDADNYFTAAQVNRKLKELGLVVSKKRKVQVSLELRDEDPNSSSINQDIVSDDETLFSLTNRNKRKRIHAFNKDQEAKIKILYEQFKDQKRCSYMIAEALDADNYCTAAQVNRKLKELGLVVSKKRKVQVSLELRDEDPNSTSINQDIVSDDETLFSLINRRKTKHTLPKLKHRKQTGITNQDATVGGKSEEVAGGQFVQMEVNYQEFGEKISSSLIDSAETKVVGNEIEDTSNAVPINDLDQLTAQSMDNELEDTDDETDFSADQSILLNRRKLRMVLDLEDDE